MIHVLDKKKYYALSISTIKERKQWLRLKIRNQFICLDDNIYNYDWNLRYFLEFVKLLWNFNLFIRAKACKIKRSKFILVMFLAKI